MIIIKQPECLGKVDAPFRSVLFASVRGSKYQDNCRLGGMGSWPWYRKDNSIARVAACVLSVGPRMMATTCESEASQPLRCFARLRLLGIASLPTVTELLLRALDRCRPAARCHAELGIDVDRDRPKPPQLWQRFGDPRRCARSSGRLR